MKKMFLASCIMAAAVFAAPEAPAAAAAAPAPAAAPATPAAQPAAAPAAEVAAPAPAAQPAAEAAAPAAEAAAPAAPAAEAAPAEAAVAPAAPAAEAAAPAEAVVEAPAAEAAPAEAVVEAPAVEAAPVAEATADTAAAPAAPATEVAAAEAAPATEVAAAAPAAEEKAQPKKKRKKKKMIENAVMSVNQINFDINADFELEAGKVFWTSEDDKYSDNLETWNGEANFAVLAETDDFKGKISVAFYPGDLLSTNNNDLDDKAAKEAKKEKKESLREGTNANATDYFSLDEAWAMQGTDYFTFKVGRWDNTDKSGDYFGGYIDGYVNGFLSTQSSENQLQFGFTPTDNMDMHVSLISKSENLDKGDIRAAFNFHGLEGLEKLKVQLAYRSNLFDAIYDSDADIKHNVSAKFNLPVNKNFDIFAEGALMDLSDDIVIPVTGGITIYTPVVDRIIVEAEYVGDRFEHTDFGVSANQKHVKDVLGAIYLEKAFTNRFSLSAGFHSYGSTKDYMLSGNLVGRIN